jgi:Leucine-rich repeat (LRR) protein
MKQIYFLFTTLFFINCLNAQNIVFNDYNLKEKLILASPNNYTAKDLLGNYMKIDLNNDHEIQISEALNVYSIGISGNSNVTIRDLKGLEKFSNLRYFFCSDADIPNLDLSELSNLIEVEYIRNNTNTINVTGLSNLEKLNIWQNNIANIDFSGLTNLKNLECISNKLSSLDINKLKNLEVLSCDGNGIQNLDITSVVNLKELNCANNKISFLDLSRVNNLEILDCNTNDLTVLNFSNLTNLKNLNVRNNKIGSIDVSNLKKLESLNCYNNLLSLLDASSLTKLHTLYCSYNNLTSINVSGCTKLSTLDCSDNELTTIDVSDCKDLYTFNCSFNKLIALYLKNGFVTNYNQYFSFNPTLKYICADESEVLDFQYRVNNLGYNCVVNSYCSFSPGGDYYTIQGNQKFDFNNNGCDALDIKFPNLNFSITDGTIKGSIISDESGNYSIPVSAGKHTMTPILENSNYYTVSPQSLTVNFPTDASPFTQNFCIIPKGVHQDLEISILSILPARPGFDANYKIIYKNKATKTVSGSVTLDFNDAVLDFVSSVPNIKSQTTNKLVWDYTDFKPLETREIEVVLNVNSPTEKPSVNINDRLSFNALITPIAGDEKPVDNSFAMRQTVVGSFDPNDKTCLEGDVVTPELIGEYVHYLIRFENTGTYPAENVVIKDMIDLSKFDISTLVLTSASHSYITKISDGNKVEFIFENINLPFDDANNDGYIAFKIKTLPILAVGDSFTNEANIYFDYNFPILTNKATSTFKTTLGDKDFEFSKYFSIYPNPVNDVLNLSKNTSIEVESISVYDVLGQLVIAVPNAENVSTLNVSKLRTGNYLVKIKSDKGEGVTRFIKK